LLSLSNIKDNTLLLCHGTADDNVHFQNSMEASKVLIASNIQFETQVYPNFDHGITAREHIYRVFSNFLQAHKN
jgi:dipeptidyl-peptidase-4